MKNDGTSRPKKTFISLCSQWSISVHGVVLLYIFVHIAQAIFFDPITIIKNSHTAIYRDRAAAWKEGWKERRNESLKGVHLGSRWVFSLLSFRLQHPRPSNSNVSHQYCPPYTTECAQYCIMQKASDRWVACNMLWHSIHLSRHFCKNDSLHLFKCMKSLLTLKLMAWFDQIISSY